MLHSFAPVRGCVGAACRASPPRRRTVPRRVANIHSVRTANDFESRAVPAWVLRRVEAAELSEPFVHQREQDGDFWSGAFIAATFAANPWNAHRGLGT